MSHFSVCVITETQPSQDDLKKIMMPWHEFECTGYDNEYVDDIDQTAEARAQYETETTRRLKSPMGDLFEPYDGRFYRDITPEEHKKSGKIFGSGWSGPAGISYHSKDWGDGRGYRAKANFIPDGYIEVNIPCKDIMTFREYCRHEYNRDEVLPGGRSTYGFIEVSDLGNDGEVLRVIDRTNPNKKWDWWQIGGRYSGKLRLKPGVQRVVGKKGLMGSCSNDGLEYGDQAMLADIDFATMRADATAEAGALWTKVHKIAGHLPTPDNWDTVRESGIGIDEARTKYWAQPAISALKEALKEQWSIDHEIEAVMISRQEFCDRQADSSFSSYAVVKDGQWHQRGEMGWWGMAHNEKDKGEWNKQFSSLLSDLSPSTWLTVVDCHI